MAAKRGPGSQHKYHFGDRDRQWGPAVERHAAVQSSCEPGQVRVCTEPGFDQCAGWTKRLGARRVAELTAVDEHHRNRAGARFELNQLDFAGSIRSEEHTS